MNRVRGYKTLDFTHLQEPQNNTPTQYLSIYHPYRSVGILPVHQANGAELIMTSHKGTGDVKRTQTKNGSRSANRLSNQDQRPSERSMDRLV